MPFCCLPFSPCYFYKWVSNEEFQPDNAADVFNVDFDYVWIVLYFCLDFLTTGFICDRNGERNGVYLFIHYFSCVFGSA